jgi:hypothetical protein
MNLTYVSKYSDSEDEGSGVEESPKRKKKKGERIEFGWTLGEAKKDVEEKQIWKVSSMRGVKICQKTVTVPGGAKTVPLGQKRKRERPTLAKKALLI